MVSSHCTVRKVCVLRACGLPLVLFFLPLFTHLRGSGILRTSPLRSSKKLRQVLYFIILTLLLTRRGSSASPLSKGGGAKMRRIFVIVVGMFGSLVLSVWGGLA